MAVREAFKSLAKGSRPMVWERKATILEKEAGINDGDFYRYYA